MKYVEKNLRPNEQLLAKAKISFVAILPALILVLIILLIGFVALENSSDEWTFIICLIVALVIFLVKLIQLKSIELGLSDKKIIGKTGVFLAHSLDTYLEKIDNISISESVFGNIFGYATIEICTVSARLRFPYVKKAIEFKHMVMDQIEKREYEKMEQQARLFKAQ
jgi:uncharacterized membrane protein YdbT with pleckstrin-like domain